VKVWGLYCTSVRIVYEILRYSETLTVSRVCTRFKFLKSGQNWMWPDICPIMWWLLHCSAWWWCAWSCM